MKNNVRAFLIAVLLLAICLLFGWIYEGCAHAQSPTSLNVAISVDKTPGSPSTYTLSVFDYPDTESGIQSSTWNEAGPDGVAHVGNEWDYCAPVQLLGAQVFTVGLAATGPVAAQPSIIYNPKVAPKVMEFFVTLPPGQAYVSGSFAVQDGLAPVALSNPLSVKLLAAPSGPPAATPVPPTYQLFWVVPAPVGGQWVMPDGSSYNGIGFTWQATAP